MFLLKKLKLYIDNISLSLSTISEKKYAGLIISLFYSLLMLVLGLTIHRTGSYQISSENDFFSSYIFHAEKYIAGKYTIDAYHGPLYLIALALLKIILKDFFISGIIISSVSAGFFLFFTYSTLKKVFSGRLALIVVFLAAVNPLFVLYSYGAGTDMFFCAICSGCIYFLLSANGFEKWKIMAAGAFAGLAFLTRYNAVFLLISIPVIILITKIAGEKFKTRAWAAGLFLAVVVLVTSPWGLYTLSKTGVYFYNENYRNVAISLGNKEIVDWDKTWKKNAYRYTSYLDIIKKDPGLLFQTVASNIPHHFVRTMFVLNTAHIGLFSIIGILFLRIKKITRYQLAYYFINTTFFVLLLPIFYDRRFFLFLIPFCILLAGLGMNALERYIKIPWWFTLLALFYLSFRLTYDYNKDILPGQKEIRLVAEDYFSKYTAGKDRTEFVAARLPQISYHLKMRWAHIPLNKSVSESIIELKSKKVHYLYFSELEIKERGSLKELINPVNAPADLVPLVYLPGEPAVLYKIIYN